MWRALPLPARNVPLACDICEPNRRVGIPSRDDRRCSCVDLQRTTGPTEVGQGCQVHRVPPLRDLLPVRNHPPAVMPGLTEPVMTPRCRDLQRVLTAQRPPIVFGTHLIGAARPAHGDYGGVLPAEGVIDEVQPQRYPSDLLGGSLRKGPPRPGVIGVGISGSLLRGADLLSACAAGPSRKGV